MRAAASAGGSAGRARSCRRCQQPAAAIWPLRHPCRPPLAMASAIRLPAALLLLLAAAALCPSGTTALSWVSARRQWQR